MPLVDAAKDISARRHVMPRMAAADWFMRELALSILGGELGSALIGVTQLAWSWRAALKILMFWVSLSGIFD